MTSDGKLLRAPPLSPRARPSPFPPHTSFAGEEASINDIIEACQAIAGYSEAQIVQALVAIILGDDEAARYQGAAKDIPVALRGGITIVLQTAD